MLASITITRPNGATNPTTNPTTKRSAYYEYS